MLKVIILKLLNVNDMYGYELNKTINEKSKGYFKMKEETLYPILYDMENKKLIESYWSKINFPRKYYRITKDGQKFLEQQLKELRAFKEGITRVLN